MNEKVLLKMTMALGLAAVVLLTGCAPVTLSSAPSGATVYKKNGKEIGKTPLRVNLYANSKEVVLRKGGYFSKTVSLSPIGPKNIDVGLKFRAKVLLLSHPDGAEVYADGEKVGRTPYKIDYRESYREFEIRSFGYEPHVVDVSDDPEGNVIIDLIRQPSLMLASKPNGAGVFDKNGQKLGITPMAVPAVKEHSLELRKEGYYSQQATVGPKSKIPFVVELVREPIVIIHSDPEGALVTHWGVEMGKTPYRSLAEKQLDLELSMDRYYSKKITVNPDSPEQVKVKLDPKLYVTVQSAPAGAELYRSGGVELIGKTPVEVLVERDTALEMRKSGYAIKPFTLSANSSKEVTVALQQSGNGVEKTVLIDSTPSGAKVYRPGGAELIGTTPLKQSVSYERTFELQHEGYKTKIVTIASDSSDSVVFALAKDGSAGNVAISDPLLNTPSSF